MKPALSLPRPIHSLVFHNAGLFFPRFRDSMKMRGFAADAGSNRELISNFKMNIIKMIMSIRKVDWN